MPSTFTKSLVCLFLLSTAFAQQEAQDMPLNDLDEVTQQFEPLIEDYDLETPSGEKRLLKNFNNLRIGIDYEHVDNGAGTASFKTYIKSQLIPAVVDYLQGALKIKYPATSPIKSSARTLCGFSTPAALKEGIDADIVIFFNTKDATGYSWMAATTLCTVASGIKRPMIVNIGINTASIKETDESNPLRHDLNINVLAHEFIHALGMNGPLYNYFVDDEGNLLKDHIKTATVNGGSRTVLDLPYLTDRLKSFYGCDSIPGLVMESGTAHVSRRFFQWDIMSTGGITGSKISEVTLGFLEGTGWYVPDYCFAEPYNFGRGAGCDFYSESINSANYPDEYCTGNGIGCTEVGHSGGYCVSDSLIKVGRVVTHQLEFNCENPAGIYYSPFSSKQVYGRGLGSKCFSGNLTTGSKASQTSYCLKFTCEGSGLNTVLNAHWGDDKIVCKKEGPLTVGSYKGEFNCPDPVKFCSTIGQPTCLRNCMGRGTCLDGKCVCDAGFGGIDCGFALNV